MNREESNRQAKAYRLADHFDETVRFVWTRVDEGTDVPLTGEDIVNLARTLSTEEWEAYAESIGVRRPSPLTIELIIKILDRRATPTEAEEDPFTSFGDPMRAEEPDPPFDTREEARGER